MKKDKFLEGLPPNLRAKMMLAEQDEGLQKAVAAFGEMADNIQDAISMLTTVAWDEAATADEKEDAVRAGAVVLTFLQQIRAVLTIVLPPQVRQPIIAAIVKGMSKECMQYDALLREKLPEAAKNRADFIAASRAPEQES